MAASIALVAIVGCVYMLSTSKWNNSLLYQQSQIEQIQNEINIQKQSIDDTQKSAIKAASGVDFERVEKDNKTAESFLKVIMTWKDYEEYEKIRQKMINDYKLPEDGSFMQVFLPEVLNKTSKDGKNYNEIDNKGLNVTYEDMESYVTRIAGDTYSYFTIVEWSTVDKKGNEAGSRAIFAYDIDNNGGIASLEGYTID